MSVCQLVLLAGAWAGGDDPSAFAVQLPVPARRVPLPSHGQQRPAGPAAQGVVGTGGVGRPEPPPLPETPLPEEKIEQLVADLDSDSYAARRGATAGLKEGGAEVVPGVARAVETGGLEVTIRGLEVLEAVYASGDESASLAAEMALERLAASENHSAGYRAAALLDRYYDKIQEPRLVERLRSLGAEVEYGGIPVRSRTGLERAPIGRVVLGNEWKGGDEHVHLIKKLKDVQQLYVVRTPDFESISPIAEEEIRRAHPGLEVHYRGRASLGVRGGTMTPRTVLGQVPGVFPPAGLPLVTLESLQGVIVSDVIPGGGAEQGGVHSNDVIVGFDGEDVQDFDDLIDLIKRKSPGEPAEVEVVRGASESLPVRLKLTVEMGRL